MTFWIARCYHCGRYHVPPRLARFYYCLRCGCLLLS